MSIRPTVLLRFFNQRPSNNIAMNSTTVLCTQ